MLNGTRAGQPFMYVVVPHHDELLRLNEVKLLLKSVYQSLRRVDDESRFVSRATARLLKSSIVFGACLVVVVG